MLSQRGESEEPPSAIRSTGFGGASPISHWIIKMKASLTLLISLFAVVSAEAPGYRSRFLARQQAAEAPYPPSGWKPNGPQLTLPTEQQPNREYGNPAQGYGSPASEPETATEPEAENVATAIATAVAKGDRLKKPKSERLTELNQDAAAAAAAPQSPFYYVVPNGHFQKLVLAPSADLEYYSKLQAQHSPLLVYSPQYVQVY